jgi:uncharacterized protein involved in outer membrane biogenesis
MVPFFLNVNDYKPQILALAKESLGREVTIEGEISAHILPMPHLRADGISISNIPKGSPQNLVHIKRLDVHVDLLPVFKKQLKIKRVDLNDPEIFLEKLPNGQVNWDLKPLEKSTQSPPSLDIILDKVYIHNGRITYHEKDKDVVLEEINISGKLHSLKGPYHVKGDCKTYGQNIKLDTKLSPLTNSESGGFQDVSLKIQIEKSTFTLQGQTKLLPLTFKGKLKVEGDPKMLNVGGDKKPASIMAGLFRLESNIEATEDSIWLKEGNFEIGSARPTGDIKIFLQEVLKIEGNLNNLPGQGHSQFTLSPSTQGLTGSINGSIERSKEFLDWFEIDTKALPSEIWGPLSLSTNFTLGQTIDLKDIHLVIREAKLQGDASWQPHEGGPLVIVDLSSPKIENVFKLMGLKDPKHLGAGKLRSKIQWSKTSLHLNDLKGQMGPNLTFAGDVAINHASPKPKIEATLSFNAIHADTLLAAHQTPYAEAKIFLISVHQAAQNSQWSHAPVDFEILKKFDGHFQISASQLTQKDIVISQPKLTATVQNGRLDISSLTGSLFGGSFSSKGHLTSDNASQFHIALTNANLKKLPSQGANVKLVGGKLNFTSDLTTHGKSMHALVQNLAGTMNIAAQDGVITGFDLHTLSEQLGNLKNPASLVGLLTTTMGKGQTRFSSFKGDLVFHQGVGTIQSMNLITQDGQGHASGQIDLVHYLLNIQAEFRLTQHPNIPPFHMVLSGPIDNPSRKLDSITLQKYMMENVFKGILGSLSEGKLKAGDIVGSILGGNKADPQQPSTQSKPEQVVKGLLKGLF